MKKQSKFGKRLLSFALAAALVFTVAPTSVFAAEVLPDPQLDAAEAAAKTALVNFLPTNDTTAEEVLKVAQDAIFNSPEANGATADWKDNKPPIIEKATDTAAGSVYGIITLVSGSHATRDVIVSRPIERLMNPKERLQKARRLAEDCLFNLSRTNKTTADDIMAAVKEAIAPLGVTKAYWSEGPTITPATLTESGRISGIIGMDYSVYSWGVDVELDIARLFVKNIKITTPPTKTTYAAGETFDKTGMVVSVAYTNKTEDVVTDYTVDKTILAEGDTEVTVSYGDYTTTQPITIGGASDHMHSYETEWTSDGTNHWHVCTAANCPEPTKDIAAHTPSDWIVDKEATTEEKGFRHNKCTVCRLILVTEETPVRVYTNEVTGEKNPQWTPDSTKGLTFTIDADFDKFVELKIGGLVIDPQYYTVRKGSTIITLRPDYLKHFSVGDYNVEVVYKDGVVKTSFKVAAAGSAVSTPSSTSSTSGGTSPKTGDSGSNLFLLLAIFAVAGGAATIFIAKRKSTASK